ncbi:hypothetical protein [Halogeometricum luteum]|uniref:Uncharacterized protein n=1 Tax=Halogeometricum luteum TaxID=2950537 RepID=A0ABU2G028_9EURY|nr:hypothetical protein [Halogeometricum sp. S3BR5-2]MDS0294145.1 hypothetical protein [Halogeometricum sp. S3BR5-2]
MPSESDDERRGESGDSTDDRSPEERARVAAAAIETIGVDRLADLVTQAWEEAGLPPFDEDEGRPAYGRRRNGRRKSPMNREDVDAEWLLVAAFVVLGFAVLDVPTTPVEYATHGAVLVAAVLAVFDPIRERETFLAAAMVALLAVAAVSMVDWYDRRTVVSIGLDGMFAMVLLVSLLRESHRRHRRDVSG